MSAEILVLGAMLAEPDAAADGLELLRASMFGDPRHGLIFDAIRAQADAHEGTDVVLVSERLKRRGVLEEAGDLPYLAELQDAAFHATASVRKHAHLVVERAKMREIERVARSTLEDLAEPGEESATQILDRTVGRYLQIGHESGDGVTTVAESVPRVLDYLDAMRSGKVPLVSFGISDLDHMLGGGLRPGNLCVVAGRPSMGKTSLVHQLVEHNARERPALVFQIEGSEEEVTTRLIAARSRLSVGQLTRGHLAPEQHAAVGQAAAFVQGLRITIDDRGDHTIASLRAAARRIARREPPALVVVDYLQLMATEGRESRTTEVGMISHGLKALAKEVGAPVVAVSQLSRGPEHRPDKKPQLSDLRESGDIEQDADQVLMIYRPEYYFGPRDKDGNDIEGLAEVNVAKQRNGPTGWVQMHFQKARMRFCGRAA